ncbi:Carboxylic ester hydrolase [Madurella fahalii]|uniref:Carboxylic ester hydrolase n=1 Tax=Madurella fahalii TaxID=1157608 RepID=A0ABQ0GL38_9PEZI
MIKTKNQFVAVYQLAVILAAGRLVSGFIQEQFVPPDLKGVSGGAAAPIVDLGYSQYQGSYDPTFDTNVYRGIRFAAPPKRWQLPEAPEVNRTSVIQAVSDPPRCPQSLPGPTPAVVNFNESILGNEDCLFLNVFSPANATKLPVVVWIHGGGYGAGWASSFDFSYIGRAVGNGIVSVTIQYRLGAFGFLSSAEVADQGVVNAGLHDMRFALQWVQKYISRFGGDPDQVTISGESAGGGSVMLMAMANGGTEGTSLFRRGIASSPYFPTQPNFDDALPTDYYLQFARRAECLGSNETVIPSDGSVFRCLQNADTIVLQNASAYTSYAAKFGQWAFIPVSDGTLIREQPNRQLLSGKVNGERILTGSNANEGTFFVPQNITTQSHFESFLALNYPSVAASNITSLLSRYSIPLNFTSPKFDSDGLHPPYATHVSAFAVGWQQAANNLYAEATFVCPSFWLGDAYVPDSAALADRAGWRYQFSIPNAFHGADLGPLQTDPKGAATNVDGTFRRGFQEVWGRFIVTGDPTLTMGGGNGTGLLAAAENGTWRRWGEIVGKRGSGTLNSREYGMLNLNVTSEGRTDWKVVDGLNWEGGRRERCALWARIGVM